jgi:hypothetical protein
MVEIKYSNMPLVKIQNINVTLISSVTKLYQLLRLSMTYGDYSLCVHCLL